MDDLSLDNPAWAFCLKLYAWPGVGAELLGLQDALGLDVSFLLFGLWLGAERGAELSEAKIAQAMAIAAPWARMVVHPLRGVRREIKTSPDFARPAVASFRSAVQRVELESERVQIALLSEWAARAGFEAKAAPEIAARHNLECVLRSYGAPEAVACPNLRDALDRHDGRTT
ncbi:MAG TPA: TIGR02444 family protein [Enterovirga sp.]|nr:TIGR02444 family protein [Enterovirga sp.]